MERRGASRWLSRQWAAARSLDIGMSTASRLLPPGQRRLLAVFGMVAAFLVVEIGGGLLTNSLALLADAGHMFTDAAGIGLALLAIWFARRPATAEIGLPMLGIATLGLAVNLVSMRLLQAGSETCLNLRGAYLEVLGDLLGSVAVIVAALVIILTAGLRSTRSPRSSSPD